MKCFLLWYKRVRLHHWTISLNSSKESSEPILPVVSLFTKNWARYVCILKTGKRNKNLPKAHTKIDEIKIYYLHYQYLIQYVLCHCMHMYKPVKYLTKTYLQIKKQKHIYFQDNFLINTKNKNTIKRNCLFMYIVYNVHMCQ